MRHYKPEYLGKVITPDDNVKLTDFVHNKYDSFSKVYDACKENSEDITDITVMNTEGTTFALKLDARTDTLNTIHERIKGENDITLTNDIISASS